MRVRRSIFELSLNGLLWKQVCKTLLVAVQCVARQEC
jgi:hypothetical protein